MSRYIDADALIDDIQNLWDLESVNGIESTTVLKQVIQDIRNRPTADVVERKRGEWIFDNSYAYIERYICSSCRESYKVDTFMGKPMWNYCPNCGSEMRKEVEG